MALRGATSAQTLAPLAKVCQTGVVTPMLAAVYDELVHRIAGGHLAAEASELRQQFFDWTGHFEADHPKAGERASAAWEYVLLDGGLMYRVLPELSDGYERQVAEGLMLHQWGVFEVRSEGKRRLLRDGWGGAEFLLDERDPIARNMVAAPDADAVFLGRVVASDEAVTVLPGMVWLPGDALPQLPALLEEAARQELSFDSFYGAVLRMDHALATLSRVKASFAFRASNLSAKGRPSGLLVRSRPPGLAGSVAALRSQLGWGLRSSPIEGA